MAVDKSKLLKSAEKFIAGGKIQQAIDEYLKILKENQRDWNLMIQVGDLCLKINKTPEAIQHFQKVADHYYLDGFYLKAIAIYKRINKLDPNLTEICIKLADLYLKQGLTMDAKSQLQVVSQHYLSKSQTKDAIQTLKKLIEIEPENLRTRNELAKAYKNEGMLSEAIKEYIEISDELLRKNLLKESLTVLETAHKMDHRNATILRKILTIYREQNEQDKATELLEESLRSDPANPEVLALLAESYADEGEYSRAHQTIDQAIFHTGNKEPFWILKGDLYLKEGDLDQAYTQVEPAIDRQLKRKDPDKAIGLLQKILRLDGSFHPALKRLTDIYSVLKQTPNLVTTYNQLVDALISKTLYEEAAEALEKLMELEPDNEQHQEKLDFVRSFVGKKPKKGKKAEPSPAVVTPTLSVEPSIAEEVSSEDFDISIDLELSHQPEPQSKAEAEVEVEVEIDAEPPIPPALLQTVPSIQRIHKPLPPVPPSPVSAAEGPDEERDFVSEHLIEADVFTKYGLIDKAIEQLLIITGRYANSVVAHQKLKEIYLEKGERGRAVEECVTMSKIFRRQGDMNQAEDLLSEARQIDPNHPSLEKAFKEMPATISSTDVLSEIERLAQSLRAKVPAKPKKPAKHIKTPPPPPSEPIVQAEEISIDFEEQSGLEMLRDRTPVSVLDPEKFDEVDFYIDQGLHAEAYRLLNQMNEKYPNDAGILGRLWKLKEKGAEPVELFSQKFKAEKPVEEVSPETKPVTVETPIPSFIGSEESAQETEITEELIAEDEAEQEPETFESPEMEEEQAVPEEIEETPAIEAMETVETSEVILEEKEEEKQVEEKSWSSFSGLEILPKSAAAKPGELEVKAERQTPPEQTWDLGDLSDLSENVMMVPEEEEDLALENAMSAAMDLTSRTQTEDEEEDDSVDQRFPMISEKEEIEQTSFDELEPGSEFAENDHMDVPAYPMEKEVDAALDAAFAGEGEEEEEPEEVKSKPVQATPELFEEEEDYFDLAAELEEGLLNVQNAVQEDKPADGQNYSLEEILSDFKKGVEKQLGAEDYDTRYNLGIAYKEMGLIDEAIAEFQIASKDPKRFLECCSMLGLCFVEKGMPKLAVKWYQRGIEIQGFTEEEYLGLKYEMAQAYEIMGELEQALEYYQEVYGVNAGYRNVTKKVKELDDYFRSKERPT